MRIKCVPEDFIVREIPIDFLGRGEYTIVRVEKKSYNTEDAAQEIARQLGLNRKLIGYAGSKDKHAITVQYMSVRAPAALIKRFSHENITLEVVNSHDAPLSLGDLQGNEFEIIVRNLRDQQASPIKLMPNYFGPQRFGTHNVTVGRALVHSDFEAAAILLANDDARVHKHLRLNPKDYVGALTKLPKHTLLLMVHAYQSFLWNETICALLSHEACRIEYSHGSLCFAKEYDLPDSLPIVGFGSRLKQLPQRVTQVLERLLKLERVTSRDFIIRQIPALSAEGDMRSTLVAIEELHIGPLQTDEICEGKKQRITFRLAKGSYATIALTALYLQFPQGKAEKNLSQEIR